MQQVLTDRALETSPVLVVTVGARACAFPLRHVAETLRRIRSSFWNDSTGTIIW